MDYSYNLKTLQGWWFFKFNHIELEFMGNCSKCKESVIKKAEECIKMHKNSPHLKKRWKSIYGNVVSVKMITHVLYDYDYLIKYSSGHLDDFDADTFDELMQKQIFEYNQKNNIQLSIF